MEDRIGFRTIDVRGKQILLNGQPVFLRGISFQEEVPQRRGRACTQEDAEYLVGSAKELGVNMVRLAHYQQNEYIVREAERQGIILWEEIPVWQSIDFGNPHVLDLAKTMLMETIQRDFNRCAICIWSIANETKLSEKRNLFLTELLKTGRMLDSSRLFSAAFNTARWDQETAAFTLNDPILDLLDLVGINIYLGWYAKWPSDPASCRWNVAPDKPLLITEFGGEAMYGRLGSELRANSWSEDYQARLYRDNLEMFARIDNLCGICPWLLFDYRSPLRLHPVNQSYFNRKGLLSDQGQKKKSWYIIHDFYLNKK